MNIPYVIEQNNRGERAYDIYSRLLKDRILFLGSDLNSYTASLIVAQMLYLEADNPEADISFYINSMGGHIADGLAIYDTMQYIESSVQTICIGRAYNIAALLLASGQKGKRIALKNAQILLHQPLGGLSGFSLPFSFRLMPYLALQIFHWSLHNRKYALFYLLFCPLSFENKVGH